MQHGSAGIVLRRGKEFLLGLGAGEYELQDALVPARAQRFTVPDVSTVTINADLTPVRDDPR